MRSRQRSFALYFLTLASAAAPNAARGANYDWLAPSAGTFSDPTRWTPAGGPPSGPDIARFNLGSSGYTVQFDGSVTNNALHVLNDNVTFDLGGFTYATTTTFFPSVAVGQAAGQTGTLSLSNGTFSTSYFNSFFTIGNDAGAVGTVNVNGAAGATTLAARRTYVGYSGSGSLNVTSGGNVTSAESILLGVNASATAFVSIDGTGSKITASSAFDVGQNGDAELVVTNGGELSSSQSSVGQAAGSVGTVTLDGAGTKWTSPSLIWVGSQGEGSLRLSGGATASTSNAQFGVYAGSIGSLTVTDPGSVFQNSNVFGVGNGGQGSMLVQNGGVVNSGSVLVGDDGTGTAHVTGSGSKWNINGGISASLIGNEGQGTVTIDSQGALKSTYLIMGYQPTGRGELILDGAGTTGTQTDFLMIGRSGTGILKVTGGAVLTHSSNEARIASEAGSNGTALVDGADSRWTNTSALYVGGRASGAGGTAELTVSNGGYVSSSSNTVNYAGGTIRLTNGTLQAPSVVNSGAVFDDGVIQGNLNNAAGGLLTGSGSVSGALTLANGSRFEPGHSPGTFGAGSATLGGGATFEFEINSAAGSPGSGMGWDLLAVAGGINVTATNATPIILELVTLKPDDSPGLLFDFDASHDYTWIFAGSGTGVTNFAANRFLVDTTHFANDLAGGSFSVIQVGNALALRFATVPEASSILLVLSGCLLAAAFPATRRV